MELWYSSSRDCDGRCMVVLGTIPVEVFVGAMIFSHIYGRYGRYLSYYRES